MRYSTMPQWVYVLPVVLGIGMMLAAVVFMLTGTDRLVIGLFWLATDAAFVVVCLRALGTRRDDLRVLRDGVRARGIILGAKTTGAFVNRVPQWVLRLRIEGSGDPYETTLRVLTFAPPVNGDAIDVCVDPQRTSHVVIAGTDAAAAGAAATAPDSVAAVAGALNIETQVAVLHHAAAPATAGINADGSRTFTSSDDAAPAVAAAADAATTVKMLSDLERMHSSGALADDEFDALKRKLLGET